MSGQSLIFCVGAAKSGTSWLQAFLLRHEECFFRHMKEVHYFDSLDKGGNEWHVKRQARRLHSARETLARDPKRDRNEWLPVLISDIEDWLAIFDGKTPDDAAYLDYLGYGRVDAKVVGDFTPAYGGVSRETLKHMVGLSDNVKFIYIMRDPVARLWSGFRMILAQQGEDVMADRIAQYLQSNDGNAVLSGASDYQDTLEKLLEVIPREKLHLVFYENMFSQDVIDRICGFLGIKPAPAPIDKIEHKGVRVTLPSVLKAEFVKKLEPQYSFVNDMMGGVPPEWTENMVSA